MDGFHLTLNIVWIIISLYWIFLFFQHKRRKTLRSVHYWLLIGGLISLIFRLLDIIYVF
jgi:hypothetical protein